MMSFDPSEVATNIFQAQIPLPFALNIVNCYLLRDSSGWTVVDTGLNRPEAQAVWRKTFETLGVQPRAIRQIVVTHHHPDHYGMAGWLQQLAIEDGGKRPTLLMSKREWESADALWIHPQHDYPAMVAQFKACGVPEDQLELIVEKVSGLRSMTFPQAPHAEFIAHGEEIEMGERAFHLIHAPGHSDGQLIFYDSLDRLLLSGDHVLMKITPNIGSWAHSDPQPLRRYLESLRELRDMDVRLALPGHKTLITDWRGRIDELLTHHDHRLNRMVDAAQKGAHTVYEIARLIFDFERLTIHEHRFAIAETLAHLEFLTDTGRLHCVSDEVWRYSL